MGNRLSKIYTRTGDEGLTGMADGSRKSKADLLFAVMGDVDELNSHIGLVKSHYQLASHSVESGEHQKNDFAVHMQLLQNPDFDTMLTIIQHLLFNLGGELAMPEYAGITEQYSQWLETQIDSMNTHLAPLKDFILPTGSILVSQLQVARCVCRRAERQAVALREQNPNAINPPVLVFINRLSDWLFVAARFCCEPNKRTEVLWNAEVLKQV